MSLADLTAAAGVASVSLDSLTTRSASAQDEYARLLALMNAPIKISPYTNLSIMSGPANEAEWIRQQTQAGLTPAGGWTAANPNSNVAASDRSSTAEGWWHQQMWDLMVAVEAARKAAKEAADEVKRATGGSTAGATTPGAATGGAGSGSAGARMYLPGTPAAKAEQAAWDARQAAADADQQSTWDARQKAADEAAATANGTLRHTTDVLKDSGQQVGIAINTAAFKMVALINKAGDDAAKKIATAGASIGAMASRGLLP